MEKIDIIMEIAGSVVCCGFVVMVAVQILRVAFG